MGYNVSARAMGDMPERDLEQKFDELFDLLAYVVEGHGRYLGAVKK